MTKRSAKKEKVKTKIAKKKSAKKNETFKNPKKKKSAGEKIKSAQCPECGYQNPVNAIYCGQCASMIFMMRQDRPHPSEPIPQPPPDPVVEPAFDSSEGTEESQEEEHGGPTRTIESPTDEMATGTTFAGRYRIIDELGTGGMGRVYKALDTEIDEKVALKIIRPEIAADEKMIRRFRKELKTARQISHKHVCRMYDIGTKKGIRYITMEYISGEDLKHSMKRMGQFTVGKAVFTAKQICEGLAEAHKLGIVHRDLKPQNIMIDEFGNARIMDFGIARSLKSEELTKPGEIIGTRVYMSPEQAEGREVDQRSDIFSLGLILYEMLANRLPFEEDIPLSLAAKHMAGPLKGPREYNLQVPEDLDRLILKCLEKDREKRYQSAEEVLEDLDKIDSGVTTAEKSTPERMTSTSREITVRLVPKKLLLPGLIGIGVLAAVILVWLLFLKKNSDIPEGKPSLAVMYFKNNTGDAGLDHWREMIADSIVADLNQSRYVDVLSGERLYQILSDLNQLDARTYSSSVIEQVAARGGVNHVLIGDFAKAGDTIRIHVNLINARKEKTVATVTDEAVGTDNILAMVDRLTKEIKARFDLTKEQLADDLDMEVAQITTSSPEAYKYYVEGRRKHLDGKNSQSIEAMEKAVAIDPDFAMAYRSIAVSYGNMGLAPQQKEYIQKALDVSGRLSERERYQIQGDFFSGSEETFDQAIEAFDKLIDLYPDDTTACHNLAVIYYKSEKLGMAQELLERCLDTETEFIGTYWLIAEIYMMKGRYDRAEKVLRNFLENVSDHPWIHQYLVFNYICQRQFQIALAELDIAFPLAPKDPQSFYLKGLYDMLTGNFIKAEKEFPKAARAEEPSGAYLGWHGLASLDLVQGRLENSLADLLEIISGAQKLGIQWIESQARSIQGYVLIGLNRHQEALREFDKAWEVGSEGQRQDLQRLALHYKGLAYLGMGSRTRAQRTAEELKSVIESWADQKEIRRFHHLMGMIELNRKNYSRAIDHLEAAWALMPSEFTMWTAGHVFNNQALYLDSLALAYYRSGDLEKAIEHYKKITMLSTGRFYFGDIYAKSFYTLGRIYQQMGDLTRAEENYNKFLALWFNADSSISEVGDAQRRLSGLNREP